MIGQVEDLSNCRENGDGKSETCRAPAGQRPIRFFKDLPHTSGVAPGLKLETRFRLPQPPA